MLWRIPFDSASTKDRHRRRTRRGNGAGAVAFPAGGRQETRRRGDGEDIMEASVSMGTSSPAGLRSIEDGSNSTMLAARSSGLTGDAP